MINQRGQVTVEYILIMVVLVGITLAVRTGLNQSGLMPDLVKKPWKLVAGMLESGVWAEPAAARNAHPGRFSRHLSFQGDQE